ncbi:hypothetical protein E1K64_22990 [Salmonella enterica subsp. enterica serovar Poona]|nr:hypothetical protein [Salmonella enterica subsp. enterica serovar Poona]
MFSVVYHPEAREEATALPVKIRVKFDRLIGKLEYDARLLREPDTKPLGDGLFEISTMGTDIARGIWVYHKGNTIMAAIGSTPFERGDDAEGFLIVTSAADKGLVDIHDRRPLVLSPDAAREWMRQGISGKEVEEIITDGAVPTDKFTWHAVKRVVGNVKNQGEELIKPVI